MGAEWVFWAVLAVLAGSGIAILAIFLRDRPARSRPPVKTARPRPPERPPPPPGPAGPAKPPRVPRPASEAPDWPVTLTHEHVRVTVDRTTLAVGHERSGVGSSRQDTREYALAEIEQLVFDRDALDPVVALYLVPVKGRRIHLLDAKQLPQAHWERLAQLIEAATGGRLRLDLSRRDGRGTIFDL